ncbi:MAG TPA: glycosyltransferase [Steroidobacteraceae bacterium]|nr:glycosyltransferase [Steroidobacteraceae bacterium]
MTVINGLWIGPTLSPMERACVQSFLRFGHEFHLYTYDVIDNVPSGCTIRDASKIVPASEIFVHQQVEGKGSLATFSDRFRYELLYQQGGWWMDMDVFCLTPTLPDAGVVIGRQDAQLINGAVLRFPAGHVAMERAIEEARACGSDAHWTEIGPALLTRLVTSGVLADAIFPEQVFYPLHYSQYWAVFDPRRTAAVAERLNGAACLHLWNEMLRRGALDKTILPPDGSMLRNLYEWTIGVEGFTHEYVLAPDSPQDSLSLRTIERR